MRELPVKRDKKRLGVPRANPITTNIIPAIITLKRLKGLKHIAPIEIAIPTLKENAPTYRIGSKLELMRYLKLFPK